MQKVLQVTSKLFKGGAEAFIMNVYRNIDRGRFQFDFLVFHEEREFYEEEIESLGGTVFHVPVMEGSNLLKRREMIDAFFAEHNDYVAVHGHMAALGRDYLAAAERAGIPNRFSHSHIADFERNPRGYLKRIFEKGFGIHSTKRFACSRWAGEYMYGDDPFIVINNGIDTAYFAYDSIGRAKFRTSLNITDDEPLVGNVGRLELMKNQEFLIDVFAAMVHKGFPGKLVLAGDGSLRTKIENRVRLKGVSNRVILLGVYEDMPSFYAGIDLFIMTSIFEGLPFSAIEAQCSGLPCVLSDSISTECKVTNNVNFESLDSDANLWADLVITMLEASTPREDASLAVSNAGYDIKDTVRLLQEYYEGR